MKNEFDKNFSSFFLSFFSVYEGYMFERITYIYFFTCKIVKDGRCCSARCINERND